MQVARICCLVPSQRRLFQMSAMLPPVGVGGDEAVDGDWFSCALQRGVYVKIWRHPASADGRDRLEQKLPGQRHR